MLEWKNFLNVVKKKKKNLQPPIANVTFHGTYRSLPAKIGNNCMDVSSQHLFNIVLEFLAGPIKQQNEKKKKKACRLQREK